MPAAPSAAVTTENTTRPGGTALVRGPRRPDDSSARKPAANVRAMPTCPHARRNAPRTASRAQRAANPLHHGNARSESDNAAPPFSRPGQLRPAAHRRSSYARESGLRRPGLGDHGEDVVGGHRFPLPVDDDGVPAD